MIEDAARTIREMGRIGKDSDLLKAAEKQLEVEQKEGEEAKKYINAINAKSNGMKVKEEQ